MTKFGVWLLLCLLSHTTLASVNVQMKILDADVIDNAILRDNLYELNITAYELASQVTEPYVATTQCAPGTISDGTGIGCTPCARGTFNAVNGSATCLPCAPGSVAGVEGLAECGPCVANTFAEFSGSVTCEPCFANAYASPGFNADCTCIDGFFKVKNIAPPLAFRFAFFSAPVLIPSFINVAHCAAAGHSA